MLLSFLITHLMTFELTQKQHFSLNSSHLQEYVYLGQALSKIEAYNIQKYLKQLLKEYPEIKYIRLVIEYYQLQYVQYNNKYRLRNLIQQFLALDASRRVEVYCVMENQTFQNTQNIINYFSGIKQPNRLSLIFMKLKVSVKIKKAHIIQKSRLQNMQNSIHYGQSFVSDQFLQEYPKIQQWSVRSLEILPTKKNNNLLKAISQIVFSQLLSLQLSCEMIESIELLSRLRASLLRKIKMGETRIISLKPLNKIQSAQIETISLSALIKEIPSLSEYNFPLLKQIVVCSSNQEDQPKAYSQSLLSIARINTQRGLEVTFFETEILENDEMIDKLVERKIDLYFDE